MTGDGKGFFALCPNCSTENIDPLLGFETKHLSTCRACHLVFDRRIPSPEDLRNFYQTYAYTARKVCPPATIDSYQSLLDSFEGWRSNNRILDVGCGQGDFLLSARKRGWEVFGTEYSPAAVKLCRDEGLSVLEGPLSLDAFHGLDFDLVTSFEVFEHINNGAKEISTIASKLRPGGLLYLTTPNFNALLRHLEKQDFKMIAYPEHITFYTPTSIVALARQAGLSVHRVATTGLAPGRLKAALWHRGKRQAGDAVHTSQAWRRDTADLREKIRLSRGLQLTKAVVDRLLMAAGMGDTLKAWLVKPEDETPVKRAG